MDNIKKKKYEKPKVMKIKLDAKCAMLGFCKTSGPVGPGVPNCAMPVPCTNQGS